MDKSKQPIYSYRKCPCSENGVTLTIEAGATINLNGYYILVNDTLQARGSSTDKIYFNGGQIIFTQFIVGWNQETQSGSIIQYVIASGLA